MIAMLFWICALLISLRSGAAQNCSLFVKSSLTAVPDFVALTPNKTSDPLSNCPRLCANLHPNATLMLREAREQENILYKMDTFWMPMYQKNKANEPSGNWVWRLDNSSVDPGLRWCMGQPDDFGGNEQCAVFNTSCWSDISCTGGSSYRCTCQIKRKTSSPFESKVEPI
jgi:hypothetical protein